MSHPRLLLVTALLATGLACDALAPTTSSGLPGTDPDKAGSDDTGEPDDTADTSGGGANGGNNGVASNNPPRAVIVRPQGDLFKDDTVTLDGSGSSDIDQNDTLTYAWTLLQKPPGSSTSILNATNAIGDLFLDKVGEYRIELVVDDGKANDKAEIRLTALSGNNPPKADAGLDQTVEINTTVYLSGAGSSDPDGNDLEYEWKVNGPSGAVSLSGASNPGTAISPSFFASQAGFYSVTLRVFDGELWSQPDTMTVQARDSSGSSANNIGGSSSSSGCDLGCSEDLGVAAQQSWTAGDLASSGGLLVLPMLVAFGYRRREED
ncbi:MAG: PKD domain-containing protein [Alphaproteobacteria bacterium]|nr:PKD domain-containing protein [Alphaproteobacteria bacterium]